MKLGRKEALRDLYETPKGHCPPASRGHAPNFGVFFQNFGWLGLGFIISSSTDHIAAVSSLWNSSGTRGWPRLGEIHKLPIGGPHGPLEVGLFLVSQNIDLLSIIATLMSDLGFFRELFLGVFDHV